MPKDSEIREGQDKWRQIPNLKPPVREFKHQADDLSQKDVDEFNEMIRQMRRQGGERVSADG